MNQNEKLIHYATAKRITTQKIPQFIDGDLVDFWVGKLRGKIISTKKGHKFGTKEEAKDNAILFRNDCINQAKELNLL